MLENRYKTSTPKSLCGWSFCLSACATNGAVSLMIEYLSRNMCFN